MLYGAKIQSELIGELDDTDIWEIHVGYDDSLVNVTDLGTYWNKGFTLSKLHKDFHWKTRS